MGGYGTRVWYVYMYWNSYYTLLHEIMNKNKKVVDKYSTE